MAAVYLPIRPRGDSFYFSWLWTGVTKVVWASAQVPWHVLGLKSKLLCRRHDLGAKQFGAENWVGEAL
jgi:hypothetical protein